MSRENLELVQRALEAFEQGGLDGAVFADDARMTGLEEWPEQGPFAGREAIRRQFERLASDWSNHGFSNVDVVLVEGDWVVVGFRWNTQGAASGLRASVEVTAAFRVENGAFAEAHFRSDRTNALEAAGLRE